MAAPGGRNCFSSAEHFYGVLSVKPARRYRVPDDGTIGRWTPGRTAVEPNEEYGREDVDVSMCINGAALPRSLEALKF